jgi:hypothetical protein
MNFEKITLSKIALQNPVGDAGKHFLFVVPADKKD